MHRDAPSADGQLKVSCPFLPPSVAAFASCMQQRGYPEWTGGTKSWDAERRELFLSVMLLPPFLALSNLLLYSGKDGAEGGQRGYPVKRSVRLGLLCLRCCTKLNKWCGLKWWSCIASSKLSKKLMRQGIDSTCTSYRRFLPLTKRRTKRWEF